MAFAEPLTDDEIERRLSEPSARVRARRPVGRFTAHADVRKVLSHRSTL